MSLNSGHYFTSRFTSQVKLEVDEVNVDTCSFVESFN